MGRLIIGRIFASDVSELVFEDLLSEVYSILTQFPTLFGLSYLCSNGILIIILGKCLFLYRRQGYAPELVTRKDARVMLLDW